MHGIYTQFCVGKASDSDRMWLHIFSHVAVETPRVMNLKVEGWKTDLIRPSVTPQHTRQKYARKYKRTHSYTHTHTLN